ncbi:MAG TPA: hypothetical protein VIY51_15990 [Xanthobacteraceae bacterium]
MAVASRKRVFDMVAKDRLMIAGSHLPFPGIGHLAKAAVGYAYVPIEWGADLLGRDREKACPREQLIHTHPIRARGRDYLRQGREASHSFSPEGRRAG